MFPEDRCRSDDHWSWQQRAGCRDEDPALFFQPDGERSPARDARHEKARAICAICPVTRDCLRHSIREREPFGIWGGLSELERHTAMGSARDHQRHRISAATP
ncbi:WhiB family transcriptional regulator [Mycolicibacterium sp. P9-22]|uniref:WhiB family transcriptional regulator n=1 Tax=Mycolicibacterium sp. P9-22 TaxID=2024613 RepID=UPI0011EC3D63|nr:WhiB family transcriptional regulator [Mycolicibacterium sp. P9-22]KAA0109028.1 WhiB family transcriptional regulator [Mycolicibacterium sp. P9-22]